MDKNTDKNQEDKRRRIGDAGRAREKREQRQAAWLEAKSGKNTNTEQKTAAKADEEVKPDSKSKLKPEPKLRLKTIPKPKIELKSIPKPKIRLKPIARPKSKPNSAPKPEAKAAPKAEIKAVPKVKIKQASVKKPVGNNFRTGCSVIFLIVFVFAFSFCVKTYTHYSHAKNGILNTDEKKGVEEITAVIEIPEGASLKVISETLYEAGIIESPFFFRWKCNVEGISYNFNHGTFTVSSYMTFDELTECLMGAAEEGDYYRLTVIEGDSIYDIAESVASFGICTEEEFYEVCDSGEFDYEFIADIPERENRLEGYLFPDTYFVGYDMDAWDVVNMMLSNFNSKVYEGIYKSAVTDYSLDDIVIIASIIEKEIKYDDERRIAASVIYNRLNAGMKLQMDATVLYALKEHKSRVMEADTQVESEYNTYYIDGLPVGPIGNAGLNSFDGALNPADTDYIYYVLQNSETGQHYFTSDYDDFLRAKDEYISGL